MNIFDDGRDLPNKPPMIKKPKKNCSRCNGTGYFLWQPTVKVKLNCFFGKESNVMCPCIKLVKNV